MSRSRSRRRRVMSNLGRHFFVDQTNGNDANDGLFDGSAWKTVAQVNGETFLPKDQVDFKTDETWREALTIPSSGTVYKPITFGAYGSGADPILNGALIISGWTVYSGTTYQSALATATTKQVFMDDVRLVEGTDRDTLNDHEWAAAANVLYVRDDTGDPDITGVTIEASRRSNVVYASAKDYITLENITVLRGYWRNIRFDNCTGTIIRDLTTYQIYQAGIWLDANDLFRIQNVVAYSAVQLHCIDVTNSTNGVVDSCTSYEAAHQCVRVNAATNILVQYCTIYDGTGDAGGSGVAGDNYHDCTIQFNEFWNHRYGGVDMTATVAGGCTGNIVRYNIFHDCVDSRAVLVWGNSSSNPSDNNQIYHNLFYDNIRGIAVDGNADGTLVYNNTIYDSTTAGIEVYTTGGDHPTNTIVRNNIVQSTAGKHIYDSGNDATNTYDYNMYYDEHAGCFTWNGVAYDTFADWKTASSQDANSDLDNPDMTDPANQDFTLQSVSPCRDAGTDVGLTRDYAAVSVPQETNPAIGAYEYVA